MTCIIFSGCQASGLINEENELQNLGIAQLFENEPTTTENEAQGTQNPTVRRRFRFLDPAITDYEVKKTPLE